MTDLTKPVAPAPFQNVPMIRMVIRHVVACHIENLLETDAINEQPEHFVPGNVDAFIASLRQNTHDSIFGDRMAGDYFPQLSDRQMDKLLERSATRSAIVREARWMLRQNASVIARFVLTAHPGELTETGIQGRQRHLDFFSRPAQTNGLAILQAQL